MKKFIQDVVPPRVEKMPAKKSQPERPVINVPQEPKKGRGLAVKILLGAAVLGLLLFFGLKIVGFFSSATVKVLPKQKIMEIDFVGSGLKFETMEIETEKEISVQGTATGVENLNKKASGIIVVYNNYSSQPQTLVAGTRFETPEGKIFRSGAKIAVPGLKKIGSEITPGSAEVEIFADKPGEEYNVGLADFTIPAFKGTAKYADFYGRSKTEIKGGFIGETKVITEKDFSEASLNLENNIKESLISSLTRSKPKEFLLFPGAVKIEIIKNAGNPRSNDPAPDGTFSLSAEGKAVGFLFKERDIVSVLSEKYMGEKAGENKIRINNLPNLEFSFKNISVDNSNLAFELKGAAHFVYNVDKDTLIGELLGKKTEEYQAVFQKYPEIRESEITFKPSWWKTVPSRMSRVFYEEIIINP